MILQQLEHDADRLVPDLPPSMYDRKPVRWVVHLDAQGRCQGIDPLSGGGKKDRGKPLLVPFKIRTAGIRPLLLADKPTYTWGVPAEHPRAAREHLAYVELVERCAAETGDPAVAAVAAFLRGWDPQRDPLPGDLQADELTTFCVAGHYLVDSPAVRAFWAREAGAGEEGGRAGQCLVCGAETQVVERLPVVLKGIPNGQSSGVALVSANASAFESYGRTAALTSPVCQVCGERFGKAANALLSDERRHLRVGALVYLFWAPEADFSPVDFLSDPQPEEVRTLLSTPWYGREPAPGDDSPFFATALSAAISRAVVRGWLHTTVGDARRSLERWFRLQRLVDPQGGKGTPLSVFRLAVSLYREAKDIPAHVPETLLRAALHGGPLPDWLLAQAVRRNQAEQNVTYPRAALMKAVLCSQAEEEIERMSTLSQDHASPAYQCGRMLAELEAIQEAAVPGIKATLVDRYFSGASSAPARVFGVLLNAAQDHLSKLRKNRRGAFEGHSQRLEEIAGRLSEFPRTLDLQEQALFSLGYYHQRAASRAARTAGAEARRARLAQDATDTDAIDQNEEEGNG